MPIQLILKTQNQYFNSIGINNFLKRFFENSRYFKSYNNFRVLTIKIP